MSSPFKSVVVTYCCGGWPYTHKYIYIYICMYIHKTDNTHIRQKTHVFSVLYVYFSSDIYKYIYIYICICICMYMAIHHNNNNDDVFKRSTHALS